MHDAQRCLLAALLATALPGCAGDESDQARDLYDMAIAGDAYKSWSQFPGASPDLIKSGQHNGDFVRSYMNPVAVEAIKNFGGEFPDGTILVKEQYADAEGKTLNGHTVMWKLDGYDAEHGDWYWVAFNGRGETTTHNGKAPYCYDCHAAIKANDWVYTSFK